MGKIAYDRRRTEKKIGTRNEMHIVEQSEFPVYEGCHEAIMSETDWQLAQEKHKINDYKREKVNVGRCEVQEESENDRFSGELVTIISQDDFDREATRFLEKYYPGALKEPVPVPIRQIAGDMQLEVIEDTRLLEELSLCGIIVFKNGSIVGANKEVLIRRLMPVQTCRIKIDRLMREYFDTAKEAQRSFGECFGVSSTVSNYPRKELLKLSMWAAFFLPESQLST